MSTNRACIEMEGTDSMATGRLPPALLCHRTGLAAGTEGSCGQCDSCLWVAALEADFEREEDEPGVTRWRMRR